MIQRNSMIPRYSMIQREFRLEVWTLIILKSMITPPSLMVLFFPRTRAALGVSCESPSPIMSYICFRFRVIAKKSQHCMTNDVEDVNKQELVANRPSPSQLMVIKTFYKKRRWMQNLHCWLVLVKYLTRKCTLPDQEMHTSWPWNGVFICSIIEWLYLNFKPSRSWVELFFVVL